MAQARWMARTITPPVFFLDTEVAASRLHSCWVKRDKRNRVSRQFAVQLPPNCCRSFKKMQHAYRRWAERGTEDIALPGSDV